MSRGGQMLRERLSERTYRYRRGLLASSMLAVILSATGWVPKQISAVGVTFEAEDQVALLWLLFAGVVYFVIGFLTYAVPDYALSLARIEAAWAERGEPGPSWQTAVGPYLLLHVFDFWLPILAAGVALVCVSWQALLGEQPSAFLRVVQIGVRVLTVGFLLIATLLAAFAGVETVNWISNARRLFHLSPEEMQNPGDAPPEPREPGEPHESPGTPAPRGASPSRSFLSQLLSVSGPPARADTKKSTLPRTLPAPETAGQNGTKPE